MRPGSLHDQHHRVRRGGNREQEIGDRDPYFLAAGEMDLCPLFHAQRYACDSSPGELQAIPLDAVTEDDAPGVHLGDDLLCLAIDGSLG